jgi:hypothetical protein
MTMDKQLKAKWVEALRSGKYDQCRNELTDGMGGFCCIGVAYEVSGKSAHELTGDDDAPTFTAAKLMGLRGEYRDTLIRLNDGDANENGKSFPEIADWIEANL